MTDDSILGKLTRKGGGGSSSEPENDTEDLGAFGWLRGVRDRALMLELRRKTGNIHALSYALLQKIEFDPSAGITLLFAGQKVVIRGTHLNADVRPNVRLFEGLTRHKIPWIQEASGQAGFESSSTSTIVDRIDW